jgi:molybdate/tungstate transport system substrate-binding protein
MSAELLSLLEVGELDYIFTYRSVAEQHKLNYIILPDEINFRKPELSDYYRLASVRLTGNEKGTTIIRKGEPIVYGVTIPVNAPNPKLAHTFLSFLLDASGGLAILKKNGQQPLVPSPTDTFDNLPDSLKQYALPTASEIRQ